MKTKFRYLMLLSVFIMSAFAYQDPIISPPVECVTIVRQNGVFLTVKQIMMLCTGAT